MFKLMSESVKSFKTLIRKLKSNTLVFCEITEAAQHQEKVSMNEAHTVQTTKSVDESFSDTEVKLNLKVLIQTFNFTMTAVK